MREHRFEAGEVPLNVAEAPCDGPPLILLHGIARKWQDWLSVIPGLATRWRVLAADHRGHGRSGRAPGQYLVRDYARDAAVLLWSLDEPAVLVGHSLGAMVAAMVAAAAPERVRAVVLEDPPLEMMGRRIGETMYLDLFRDYRDLTASTESTDALARALANVPIALPGRDPVRLGETRDAASLRFSASCLRSMDPDAWTPVLDGRWLDHCEEWGELAAKVEVPAFLIQGDFALGGTLPDDLAAGFASRLRKGLHVRLPQVGHLIHGTAPHQFLAQVHHFLESID